MNKKQKEAIVRYIGKYYFLLSSVLLTLSFPISEYFPLSPFFAWIALVPVFYYIFHEGSLRKLLVNVFFFAVLFHFLNNSWMGQFGKAVPFGNVVILIFLIPALSLVLTTKLFLAEYLHRKLAIHRGFIYPVIWVSIDFLQRFGFLGFPWINIGYTQYPFTSFIQLASFTGVTGVTFVIILMNVLLASHAKQILLFRGKQIIQYMKSIYPPLALGAIVLIITTAGFINTAVHSSGPLNFRVAMIQCCLNPWDNWNMKRFFFLGDHKRYTERAIADQPSTDLVIWSESATLQKISYDYAHNLNDQFEKAVLDTAVFMNKPLITGEIGYIDQTQRKRPAYQNNAAYINANGEVVGSYSKVHLAPIGEWFPYGKWFPALQQFMYEMGSSNFAPGDGPKIFELNSKKFGVVICYEGVFPEINRKYKQLGAEFLVNITNDGWSSSYQGHMQHFSAGVFRTVENGIWYVRSGNTGYTALVDPYGRVVNSIPILKKGYLTGGMDLNLDHETFYSKYGEIFYYLLLVSLIIILTYKLFLVIISYKRKGE